MTAVAVGVLLFLLSSTPLTAQVVTLNNTRYIVKYDVQQMTPIRVSWSLHKSDLGAIPRSCAGSFRVDKRVPKPRPASSDYRNTGFERGHLCPSADWASDASLMAETFLMSNVVPMMPSVNKGAWKVAENATRQLAQVYDSVRVVVYVWFRSGHPNTISKKRIPIPDAFGRQVYKAANDSLVAEWYVNNL